MTLIISFHPLLIAGDESLLSGNAIQEINFFDTYAETLTTYPKIMLEAASSPPGTAAGAILG